MSIAEEFATVSLILNSQAETRGMDAFALSLIKAERQVRKLVTHLVYQFPVFAPSDVAALRNALGASRRVYFEGFLSGFDALYPRSVQDLVGSEHARLKARVDEAIDHRNKIFQNVMRLNKIGVRELFFLVASGR